MFEEERLAEEGLLSLELEQRLSAVVERMLHGRYHWLRGSLLQGPSRVSLGCFLICVVFGVQRTFRPIYKNHFFLFNWSKKYSIFLSRILWSVSRIKYSSFVFLVDFLIVCYPHTSGP